MKKFNIIIILSIFFILNLNIVNGIDYFDTHTFLYYSLDADNLTGVNPLDRTPNNNDGSNTNVIVNQTGILNEGFRFDADNTSYLSTGTTATFKFLHGAENVTHFNWSISWWMKLNDTESNDTSQIFSTMKTSSVVKGMMIYYDDRNSQNRERMISLLIRPSTPVNVVTMDVNESLPVDNEWHHVVITYDQSLANLNAKLYVDGVYIGNGNKTANTPTTVNSDFKLNIGRSGIGAQYFNHSLDEISIWKDKVLNLTEIIYLNASGNPTYLQQWPFINITDYFRVYASDIVGNPILTFNITMESGVNTYQFNTTTGTILTNLTHFNPSLWNISIFSSNYASSNILNYNISNDHNFTLQNYNSINVKIYDETTGLLINNTNITVTKIIGASQQENITSTGGIGYINLTIGNYTFRFEGDDYPPRSYAVEVTNNSYHLLNAYLLANSTDTVIFTFQEYQNNQVIEGVTLQIKKVINGTDTLIAVLTSDITGRTQFYFSVNDRYCFIASKTLYTTKEFCLDPIIFTSYTIELQTSVDLSTGDDYEEILIDFEPVRYWNNRNNSINFTFASPQGELTNYGFNATYGITIVSASGINTYGSIINDVLEITGAQYGEKVIVYYHYKKSGDTEYRSFKRIYEIYGYNTTQDSLLDNPPPDYGLGEFERTLISVGIILLVAGAGAYYGGAIAGGVLALFMFAWVMYIQFLNFWAGIISIIILFVIIGWKASQ